MDILGVSTVAGGGAGVGALVWAMLGNPNLRNLFKLDSRPRALGGKKLSRKVIDLEWRSLDQAITDFVQGNKQRYDLVVGLQPDGVSTANSIARMLKTRFTSIEKLYPGLVRIPFFVFNDSTQTRSKRESTVQFTPPSGLPSRPRILVVDGVTTFGNALIQAESEILARVPDCAQIDFFVYAVDLARLSSAHPELVARTRCQTDIDNHRNWLRFPWDAE